MQWPYAPVEFRKDGSVAHSGQVDAALELVAAPDLTDVLVVAHGWNNDMRDAEALFTELCDNAAVLAQQRAPAGRRFGVVGLLWPAVQWADQDQVAGGGLSAGDELLALLDAISDRVEQQDVAAELRSLAGRLDGSGDARAEFVRQLRRLLPDDDPGVEEDPVPPALRGGEELALYDRVAEAERAVADAEDGVAASDDSGLPPGVAPDLLADGSLTAAGFELGDLSPKRLARRLLNLTTYYTMKQRAGSVGAHGVAPLLARLHERRPEVTLHLAGHSFGARVVTAAAAAATTPVGALVLLQGAFSHWGFSGTTDPRGAFRRIVESGTVRGPIVITHTHNDRAVRLAYAVASRLAGQVASGIGDARDPYGGIGANGAVATAEAQPGALGDERTTYRFTPRRIHNLSADDFIAGHGDVRSRPVANAVLQAVLTRTT